jgi:chromosomal replication initiator protein
LLLTDFIPTSFMTSKNTTQNLKSVSSEALDWAIIQKDMKNKLGSDIYESWLRKIDFVEEMNSYVLLSVSTRFIRDWITSRYLDQILQIVKAYKKDLTRIEFKIIEKNSEN